MPSKYLYFPKLTGWGRIKKLTILLKVQRTKLRTEIGQLSQTLPVKMLYILITLNLWATYRVCYPHRLMAFIQEDSQMSSCMEHIDTVQVSPLYKTSQKFSV